jgi:hypothetical protein
MHIDVTDNYFPNAILSQLSKFVPEALDGLEFTLRRRPVPAATQIRAFIAVH